MKVLTIALLGAAFGVAAPPAQAQPAIGFGTFSINSDVNDQVFPGAAGGFLLDVAHSWASVGAQGDLFFSGGYVAGRGGPIAQLNFLRSRPVRVFALGGYAWGEQAGPMFGAGLEIWTRGRIGMRASVQDYLVDIQGFDCAVFGLEQAYCDENFNGGRSSIGHQPSFQFGIVWR